MGASDFDLTGKVCIVTGANSGIGLETAASLVQNLGAPYTGPVALNASKDVVENLGLIELYETVLRRARDLHAEAAG